MKSSEKNIQNLDLAFDSLFDNNEVDYDTEAKVLASKILSEISIITDKKELNRKSIAELIGTSASYLTQLYKGTKLLNFTTLVKLKDKLNLDFEIKIKEKEYNDINVNLKYNTLAKKLNHESKEFNWSIYTNPKNESKDKWNDKYTEAIKVSKTQLTA